MLKLVVSLSFAQTWVNHCKTIAVFLAGLNLLLVTLKQGINTPTMTTTFNLQNFAFIGLYSAVKYPF